LTFTPAGTGGFDDLRRTATLRSVGQVRVRVAVLEDIIRSKESAGRPRDQEALRELSRLAGRTAEDTPPDEGAQPPLPSRLASRIARARAARSRGNPDRPR